jgi:hypothetical protein
MKASHASASIIEASRRFLKNRRRLTLTALCTIIVFSVVLFFSLRNSYSLNPAVTHSIYTIPQNVTTYVEILDPKECYSVFEKSSFGKEIIHSKAWEKLSGTPDFQKLSNLLYFIELKADAVITYKDLPSFFGGSVGIAWTEDNEMLIVAKTNLKSRLGLALVSAFKGKTIPLAQIGDKDDKSAKNKGARKLEGVTSESYEDLFQEQAVQFANLTVTRITNGTGYLYLVMLDDYLFVSDSDRMLKEALYIAAKPESSSLRNAKGMRDAVTALERGGQILIYLDATRSSAAPLLANMVAGKGAAVVLYGDEKNALSGDIYVIDRTEEKRSAPGPVAWDKIIPQEQAIAVYSNTLSISDVVDNFSSLGKDWKNLHEGMSSFLNAAEIDKSSFFGGKKGGALVFHGLDLFNKNLYPQFSIGYDSVKKDASILRAIFKNEKEIKLNFQGVSYTALSNTGAFYIPAMYYGNAGIVSSSRLNLEKYISTSKGNRPQLGDDRSYAVLGEYAKAPHHIVLSIPRTLDALRAFYLYGAQRTGGYTSATIDRDIMPLAQPLAQYETLHIALGLNKAKTGKIVLTERKLGK